MAGPHVAGAAALLMSVNPALKGHPDQVAQLLRDSAAHIDLTQSCGGIGADEWPNYVAGHGRIDVYAAAQAVQGSPVSVDIAFVPASVEVDAPSELVLTLGNDGATPAVLTSELMHSLPGLMRAVDPVQAATTCPSGTVVVDGDFWTFALSSGAMIPAGDTCTVTIAVSAPMAATYESTIGVGALQTDVGSNPVEVSAVLEVTEDDTLFEDGFDGAPSR
jgi:hypothetical protein